MLLFNIYFFNGQKIIKREKTYLIPVENLKHIINILHLSEEKQILLPFTVYCTCLEC